MTTLQDLIWETRDLLYSNQAPEGNLLASPMGTNDTTMTLQYPAGSLGVRGTLCSIELEMMRVWAVSGNTCTVQRGVMGTVAASHTGEGTGSDPYDYGFVEVSPKFSPFAIMRAINEDLDDLASPLNGLYTVQDLELTYNAAVSGYDMTGVTPGNVLGIQEIRYKVPGPTKHLPAIRSFEVSRNVPVADYPSGMALLLNESAFPGFPLHVRYRSRFNHFTSLSDDAQAVALLPKEANGLPALGAAIQLMVGREIKRNFTEATSDPLQLELVTGGQVLNSYKGLQLQRQTRIQAVQAGLMRQYGQPLRVV